MTKSQEPTTKDHDQMTNGQESTTESLEPNERPAEIPGRWVVIGVLAFGLFAVGILWTYWELHTAPFRPLQEAIVAEFGNSSAPRVEGGRHKMHLDNPAILRVVMRVAFAPANTDQAEPVFLRIAELARQHVDLDDFDLLEVHLYQPHPEDQILQQGYTCPVSELFTEGLELRKVE